MRIATWNVNSIKARLPTVLEVLDAINCDVVCLQEIKCIPTPEDCWDETVWQNDALALPQTRSEFRKLKYLGLADSFELTDGRAHQYTFWDYQGGAFKKDHGIRIDHLLCSPQACDRLPSVEIYRKARELDKPSDHVPVIGVFED